MVNFTTTMKGKNKNKTLHKHTKKSFNNPQYRNILQKGDDSWEAILPHQEEEPRVCTITKNKPPKEIQLILP